MTRPSSPFVNLSVLSQGESRHTKSPPPTSSSRARRLLPIGPRKPLAKPPMSSVPDNEDPSPSYYQESVFRKLSEPILTNVRQSSMNNYDETPGECSSSVNRNASLQPGRGRPRGSSHAGVLARSAISSSPQNLSINDDHDSMHRWKPTTPLPELTRSAILPRYSSLNIAQPTPLRPVIRTMSPTLDSPDILSYYGLESDPYLNGMEMHASEYIRPLPPMPTVPPINTANNLRSLPVTRSSSPFPNLSQMAATVADSVLPQSATDISSPSGISQPRNHVSEKDIVSHNDGTSSQQLLLHSSSSVPQPQTLDTVPSTRSSPEPTKAENMVRPLIKPIVSISQPPSIKFDSVPIAWRGLTFEAAQWSLSSTDLQAIVSRAIHKSSEESSIRLVPLVTLDNEVANERERLNHMKVATQTKYRFLMQRRTMLLQSLAATVNYNNFDPETVGDLVRSLSELTVQCDRLLEEIHQISDQQAQIAHLIDVHAASALSVALRKLNASYAKRSEEVSELKKKLESVDMEREEAWRVAEEIAKELDEKDYIDKEPYGNAGDDGDISDFEVEMKSITGHAVAAEAKWARASRILTKMPGVGPRTRQRSDSVSSRVSAARTRSQRASKASLRIPRDVLQEQKGFVPSSPLQLPKHPPLPQIRFPSQKSASPPPPMPTVKGSSFLDLADRPISTLEQDVEQEIRKLREQTDEADPLSDDEHLRPVSNIVEPLTVVVPLRLDTKLSRREGNSRVQSMLSPDAAYTFGQLSSSSNSPNQSMTLSLITTSVGQVSDKDSSPRRTRPSSMPISAISPPSEEKPYDYF